MIKKRIRNTKIGDVFEVKISDTERKYFQYIVSDLTYLNSDVIRAFKRVYTAEEQPSIEEIVAGEVQFYSHTTTKAGIIRELWSKVGNSENVGNTRILFRDCLGDDFDESGAALDWRIWFPNDKNWREVGRLPDKYKTAEMGLVYAPPSIVYRIKTGSHLGPEYR